MHHTVRPVNETPLFYCFRSNHPDWSIGRDSARETVWLGQSLAKT